jgi:hypothetical protein
LGNKEWKEGGEREELEEGEVSAGFGGQLEQLFVENLYLMLITHPTIIS